MVCNIFYKKTFSQLPAKGHDKSPPSRNYRKKTRERASLKKLSYWLKNYNVSWC